MKTVRAIHIDDKDNCVTLTEPAETGDMVSFVENGAVRAVAACGFIPVWHKMAVMPVEKGGNVYKYGAAIGTAMEDIRAGEHVHTHNMRSPIS